MKKVILIGNRLTVFKTIQCFKELSFANIFAVEKSPLHTGLQNSNFEHTVFVSKEKERIIEMMTKTEFSIFISNGCPFIIPVSKIKKLDQLFINVHPSYLPNLRGRHPANGALLHKNTFTGATMHYMDDDIDTGNIIYQEKVNISDDLDLGLIYHITFDLESRVFFRGMRKIIDANYKYLGRRQKEISSYYSRSKEDMTIDPRSMSSDDINTRIRAFGIKSQGVFSLINNESYKVFDAEVINNYYLLNKYKNATSGSLVLEYDKKMLVKTIDGLIKIKSFEKI